MLPGGAIAVSFARLSRTRAKLTSVCRYRSSNRMIVSSLAGRARRGDHASTGAGPRTTNGVTGPTAKALPPFELTRSPGARPTSKTVEPPGVGHARLFDPALEHVLAVEMRALAIGRGSGVDDNRLVRFEHTV